MKEEAVQLTISTIDQQLEEASTPEIQKRALSLFKTGLEEGIFCGHENLYVAYYRNGFYNATFSDPKDIVNHPVLSNKDFPLYIFKIPGEEADVATCMHSAVFGDGTTSSLPKVECEVFARGSTVKKGYFVDSCATDSTFPCSLVDPTTTTNSEQTLYTKVTRTWRVEPFCGAIAGATVHNVTMLVPGGSMAAKKLVFGEDDEVLVRVGDLAPVPVEPPGLPAEVHITPRAQTTPPASPHGHFTQALFVGAKYLINIMSSSPVPPVEKR